MSTLQDRSTSLKSKSKLTAMANGFRCVYCGRQEAVHESGDGEFEHSDCPKGYQPPEEEYEWEKEMLKLPSHERKSRGVKLYRTE